MRIFASILLVVLFGAFAQAKEPISPQKLISKLLKEDFTYQKTALRFGSYSIQSCMFTSENFILFKNYCFPKRKYPARGFTVMSPKYGIFEFYQEDIGDGIETRNVRILVFPDEIQKNFNFPIQGMTFKKANELSEYYYRNRNRACWATNYSLYTQTEDANCLNMKIDTIPKWERKALAYAKDQELWYEDFDRVFGKVVEPAFSISLTQLYSGRDTFTTQAMYTPIKRYPQIVQTMRRVEKAYPETAKMFALGKADNGQVIYGIKIGHGAVRNLVVGTHHGNEYGSADVAEATIIDFARNPLSGQTIFVVPVLNIDGYNRRSRYERVTARSMLDPNRDYPGPCGTAGPFKLKSTRALAALVARAGIVSSVTLHTHFPGVLYPWGISTHDVNTPHTHAFRRMSLAAAKYSKYKVGNATKLLYPADGTFEDYAFWRHGVWSLLFEMGRTHSPTPNQVRKMIAENVPGIRNFFMMAPKTRAKDHAFKGKCNGLGILFDRRRE